MDAERANCTVQTLIRKLEYYSFLTNEDKKALNNIVARVRQLPAHSEAVREDTISDWYHVVIDGIAARQKFLSDGRRHIVSYLLPGDLCNFNPAGMCKPGYYVILMTPCTLASISCAQLSNLFDKYPNIRQAFAAAAFVEEGIMREWLINLSRTAEQRIAYLICELLTRFRIASDVEERRNELPLKQGDLADALGVTSVHANRILRKLRREGLVELGRSALIVPDIDSLKSFVAFDSQYLETQAVSDNSLERPILRSYQHLRSHSIFPSPTLNVATSRM